MGEEDFRTPLKLEYLDGRTWRLTEAFEYVSVVYHESVFKARWFVRVPAGFETDFASVPRFFWRLLPPTGEYGKASVIHDYLYETPSEPVTRAQADRIFLEAMEDLGVDRVVRYIMYAAVRAGGGTGYRERHR